MLPGAGLETSPPVSPTGAATLTSAVGFGFCAASLRRCFGWEAVTRGAFACPGIIFSFCANWVEDDLPRRGTPRASRQIHFTVPLPPSVPIRFFFSRPGNSSITHRLVKPVSLASTSSLIWRLLARLGASALGAGINPINTRYNLASPGGMTFNSHSRSISTDILAGLDEGIGSVLVGLAAVHGESFK